MNESRREQLRAVVAQLSDLQDIVTAMRDEEQDALDEMPENLAMSRRSERMEEAVASLDEALGAIDAAMESIGDAVGDE